MSRLVFYKPEGTSFLVFLIYNFPDNALSFWVGLASRIVYRAKNS